MELQSLSSNWKKLQQSLQNEKSSTKRKLSATEPASSLERHSAKRTKQIRTLNWAKAKSSSNKTSTPYRKMGLTISKPSSSDQSSARTSLPPSSYSKSNLPLHKSPPSESNNDTATNNHLSSTSLSQSAPYTDAPNSGLTPLAAGAGKYIALDCEMVGVGPSPATSSVLARVSIVDFSGHQLYDSYVQPLEEVTDYRTFVSGIQAHHLRPGSGGARTLQQVQEDVAGLMQDRVLVGHAIRNDLAALMLSHPIAMIRDTSRYKPFRELVGGRTPALRRLASELLGVEIQAGSHSSVEDARATMALFRREKAGFEREAKRRFGARSVGAANTAATTPTSAVVKNSKGRSNGASIKTRKDYGDYDDEESVDVDVDEGDDDDVVETEDKEPGGSRDKTQRPKTKKNKKKKKKSNNTRRKN